MATKSFWSVSNICEATRFANIELKFNINQEGSFVLGRSPDMTIRKVSGKHNHSPTLQRSIFDGSSVLFKLCF